MTQKENVSCLLRLRFRGICKHLTILNEQKLTPSGVNNLLLFLIVSSNLQIFGNKNQKWSVTICPCYVVMLPYAVQFYWFNNYFVSISSRYFTILSRI